MSQHIISEVCIQRHEQKFIKQTKFNLGFNVIDILGEFDRYGPFYDTSKGKEYSFIPEDLFTFTRKPGSGVTCVDIKIMAIYTLRRIIEKAYSQSNFSREKKKIQVDYEFECRHCKANCTITHDLLKKDNEGNIRGYNINSYSCPCRTLSVVVYTRVSKGTKSMEEFYKMQPEFFKIPPPYTPPPPPPKPKNEVGKGIFLGLCAGFATFVSFGLLGIVYLPVGVSSAVGTISSITGGIVSGSNAAALIYSVSGAIGSGIATIQNGGECTVVGGTPSSTVTGVINTYGTVFDPKDRLFNYFPHQRNINFNDPFDYVNSLC